MQGDYNLDGTPDVPGSSNDGSKFWGKFGSFFDKYGEVIVNSAGEVIKANQGQGKQTPPQPLPSTTTPTNQVPKWVWVAGTLGLVAVVVLVIRSRKK